MSYYHNVDSNGILTVADVITIALSPDLLVTKQLSTVEDPINSTTNPKAIPGRQVLYTLSIANQGPGSIDNDSVVVTDAIAADVCMRVTDLGPIGSGPVAFKNGTPSSNLTYMFGVTPFPWTVNVLRFLQ